MIQNVLCCKTWAGVFLNCRLCMWVNDTVTLQNFIWSQVSANLLWESQTSGRQWTYDQTENEMAIHRGMCKDSQSYQSTHQQGLQTLLQRIEFLLIKGVKNCPEMFLSGVVNECNSKKFSTIVFLPLKCLTMYTKHTHI